MAIMVALGLSLAGYGLVLNSRIPVDDRGEAIPLLFGGVTRLARSIATGQEVSDTTENVVSYFGPTAVARFAVPLLVVVVAFVLNRRWEQRSRLFTVAMLALAGGVVVAGNFGFYFMPALIAVAVASFQVRKQEMPARTAARMTKKPADDEVIDVDEVDEVEGPDGADADDLDDGGGRRGRRGRRATGSASGGATTRRDADDDVIEAGATEPDDDDAVDPADDPTDDAGTATAGGRRSTAPPGAGGDEGPRDDAGPANGHGSEQGSAPDDVLAELEEELRLEREAEEAGTDPTDDRGRRRR